MSKEIGNCLRCGKSVYVDENGQFVDAYIHTHETDPEYMYEHVGCLAAKIAEIKAKRFGAGVFTT